MLFRRIVSIPLEKTYLEDMKMCKELANHQPRKKILPVISKNAGRASSFIKENRGSEQRVLIFGTHQIRQSEEFRTVFLTCLSRQGGAIYKDPYQGIREVSAALFFPFGLVGDCRWQFPAKALSDLPPEMLVKDGKPG